MLNFKGLSQTNGIWIVKANTPTVSNMCCDFDPHYTIGFTIGDSIFVGSNSGFYRYERSNDSYVQKANIPYINNVLVSCSVNNKGYILATDGGGVPHIYEYDQSNNQWTTKSIFPGSARVTPAYFVVNNKIYIISGGTSYYNGPYSTECAAYNYYNVNQVWEYSPSLDLFQQKNNFPVSGWNGILQPFTPENIVPRGFSIENKGYVLWNTGTFLQYDSDLDQWNSKSAPNVFFQCRSGLKCMSFNAFSFHNFAYCLANDSWGSDNSKVLKRYDPISETWSTISSAYNNNAVGIETWVGTPTNLYGFRSRSALNLEWRPSDNFVYTSQVNQSTNSCMSHTDSLNLQIKFTTFGNFNSSNNVYYLQLSDNTGNFNNPINIDSIFSNTGNQFNIRIPSLIWDTSQNYKVRVISTYPYSEDETPTLLKKYVNTKPDTTLVISGNTYLCPGTVVTLQASLGIGYSYIWYKNGVLIDNATSPSYTASSIGNYNCLITKNSTCVSSTRNVLISNYLSPNFITPDSLKICSNFTTISASTGFVSYNWSNGSTSISTTVTSSGWYKCTATNTSGCIAKDSVYVSLRQPTQTNLTATACSNYTLPWGVTVYASGTYSNIYSINGCDSTVTVNVTIKNASVSTTRVGICASSAPYVWNGVSYSNSGTYSYRTNNSIGCDSIANLILTVSQPSSSITNAMVCNTSLPYIWNGSSYNNSGVYVIHLTNSGGCDSSVVLNLTVSNGIPTAPTSITQKLIDTSCGARIYRYTTSLVINANAYAWYIPTSLGGISGVSIDSGDINSSYSIRLRYISDSGALVTDSIRVRAYSGCGTSSFKLFKLTNTFLKAPSAPASLIITPIITNICGNRIYRYTAPLLPAGTAILAPPKGYLWSFSGNLGTNAILDSGTLTSRIIRVKFTSNIASVSGDSVRVRYSSSCGYSPNKSVKLANISLNPPTAPASISITSLAPSVCGSKIYRYAAPALPTATTTSGVATGYLWSFTGSLGANATLDSGTLTSRVIRVKYTSNNAATIGDSVRVQYNSVCGYSLNRALKLTNLFTNVPAVPSTITIAGVNPTTCGARVYRYTAPNLPLATATLSAANGYEWSFVGTLGAYAIIDSGNVNSQVIKVRYTSNAWAVTGDSVKLRYNSSCGLSLYKALKLTNAALNCPPNISRTAKLTNKLRNNLEAILYPNPSAGSFQLKISTVKTSPIQIIVRNSEGQMIKSFFAKPNEVSSIGEELKAGIYMVYINQGEEIKILKAVKL